MSSSQERAQLIACLRAKKPRGYDGLWDAPTPLDSLAADEIERLTRERAALLHAVYIAHGTFARQLDKDGMGPDSWGDDEHEAFVALKEAIAANSGGCLPKPRAK